MSFVPVQTLPFNKEVWDGFNITASGTYYSDEFQVPKNTQIATAQCIFEGTLVGTFGVEFSNSVDLQLTRAVEKWTPHPSLNLPAINGAMNFGVEMAKVRGFDRFRFKLVVASGAGHVTVTLNVA